MKDIETIEDKGKRYAEIIRHDLKTDHTVFFSPAESSFQFGLLAHRTGFIEDAHYHKPVKRTIDDLQQMFVVQRGKVEITLYSDDKKVIKTVVLKPGDAIVLIHGIHSLRVIKDMQCISVKQGPFMGTENDKITVEVAK